MVCQEQKHCGEQAFLESLRDAREVSIKLMERRNHQNFLQGLFHLELTATSTYCVERTLVLKKDGIRNPNSIWPAYTFTVDDSQCNFLLNKFLPALTATTLVESLTVQGCGRVQGFYTKLVKLLLRMQRMTSVSIIGWADFIHNVDHDLALPLLSRLQSFSVTCPTVDDIISHQLGLALGSMSQLRNLRLDTGLAPPSFWSKLQQAFSNLHNLEDLSWIGKLPDESNREVARLCRTLGTNPRLKNLELAWSSLSPDYIITLLQNKNLDTLSINSLDNKGAHLLGNYLEANQTLKTLNVSFLDNCCNAFRLLEGAMKHTRLSKLSLSNVRMDNDVAKTTLMLFTYNDTLQDFTLSASNMKSSFLEDILLGLRANTVLHSVALQTTEYILDLSTSLTLQEVLVKNSTLQHLNLGQCHARTNECVRTVAQGIMHNTALQSLCGLRATNPSIFVEALEHNKTLTHFSSSRPEMAFYLGLNKIGRKHFVDSNLDSALLPLVLEKAQSIDQMQYMLQARADVFIR